MEKMFTKKWIGLLFIGISYLLAIWLGVLVCLFTKDQLIIWRFLLANMASTFFIFLMSSLLENASVYDPYWSVQPLVLGIGMMIISKAYNIGTYLLLGCVALWGIRLTVHWVKTFKNLNSQDWRYANLKAKSKKLFPLVNFFGIQLFPTLIVYIGCQPMFFYMEAPQVNVFTIIGYIVMVGAVVLETFSDLQIFKYFKTRTSSKDVIDIGLWKYSRHPNYLGEISFWFGIYIVLLSARLDCWWLIFCPICMILLFVFISIPMIEKRLIKSKEDYLGYKRRTSMLLLLPQRKEK